MKRYLAKDILTLEHEKFNQWGWVQVITPHHQSIHDGNIYSHNNLYTLAAGANLDFYLVIDPSKTLDIHRLLVDADIAPVMVYMYEGPTITAPGTAVTVNNRNRSSPNVFTSALTRGPTVTAVGTRLATGLVTGGKFSGGGGGSENEWELLSAATYLIRITNNGVGIANVNVDLEFHEEAPQ